MTRTRSGAEDTCGTTKHRAEKKYQPPTMAPQPRARQHHERLLPKPAQRIVLWGRRTAMTRRRRGTPHNSRSPTRDDVPQRTRYTTDEPEQNLRLANSYRQRKGHEDAPHKGGDVVRAADHVSRPTRDPRATAYIGSPARAYLEQYQSITSYYYCLQRPLVSDDSGPYR